ncbi:MAG: hypothetical protein RIT26_205 [Pseudomonadota bacterium]
MIHIVYPHADRPTPPDVIGQQLAQAVSGLDEVRLHTHHTLGRIRPQVGDVLIGHAYPCPYSTLRWSWRQSGWGRRILLQPFSLDDREHGHLDDLIASCDWFLAITGDYWWQQLPQTRHAPCLNKIRQLDLGLDRSRFRRIKTDLAPASDRRWLYIGNDHPGKGLNLLNQLAQALGLCISWAGEARRSSPRAYPHLRHLGHMDWSTAEAQQVLAAHDFLIMVGQHDACPTTVIEAMAWGLVPVCRPSTGYDASPGVLNLRAPDVVGMAQEMRAIQSLSTDQLEPVRQAGEKALETRFRWDLFASTVKEAVQTPAPAETQAIAPRRPKPLPAPYRSMGWHCRAALARTCLPERALQAWKPWGRP